MQVTSAIALARLRADLGTRLRPADTLDHCEGVVSSGAAALDGALGGGLPRGRLVEAIGTGRTSLALAAAAAVTRRGALVAWIDAACAFDASSAVRAGIDCRRLLVAQAQGLIPALRATDVVLAGGGFQLVVLDRVGVRGRVPDSAWARLARRAEQADACVLALGERTEAGTFAQVAVRMAHRRVRLGPSLLGQVTACVEILRAKRRAALGQTRTELVLEPSNVVERGKP